MSEHRHFFRIVGRSEVVQWWSLRCECGVKVHLGFEWRFLWP